jgi:hypothetical protein
MPIQKTSATQAQETQPSRAMSVITSSRAALGGDTLIGGGGNDVFDGGAGTDVVIFGGKYENYTLTITGAGTTASAKVLTVAANAGSGFTGTSTFTAASGVESIRFVGSSDTVIEVGASLTNSASAVVKSKTLTSGADVRWRHGQVLT